jgi:predicted nucleic acid-binding protein
VKWVVHEQDTEKAIVLLSSELELVAPDIVLVETANALWKNVRRGLLAPDRAQVRLGDLPRFFDKLLPTPDLVAEAFTLGQTVDVPIYDCLYVVASRRAGAKLVTADRKLIAKLVGTPDSDNVLHIGDWT